MQSTPTQAFKNQDKLEFTMELLSPWISEAPQPSESSEKAFDKTMDFEFQSDRHKGKTIEKNMAKYAQWTGFNRFWIQQIQLQCGMDEIEFKECRISRIE